MAHHLDAVTIGVEDKSRVVVGIIHRPGSQAGPRPYASGDRFIEASTTTRSGARKQMCMPADGSGDGSRVIVNSTPSVLRSSAVVRTATNRC